MVSKPLGRLSLATLFFTAWVAASLQRNVDPDLFGHLLFGEFFLRKGVIFFDIFSYTARGAPWVDHEWLSEIFFAAWYRMGGLPAVFFSKFLLLSLFALALFAATGLLSRAPVPRLFSYGLSLLIVGHFGLARPQLFTYLFLAAFFLLFYRRPNLLPLLFLAWANFHGGFAFGLLLLTVLVGITRSRTSSLSQRRSKQAIWLSILAASFAATLLNPYGIRLHQAIVRALLNPLTPTAILEWKPPHLTNPFLAPLLLALLIGYGFSPKKRWGEEGVLLLVAAAALHSIRHIPLLAILLAVYLPRHLENLFPPQSLWLILSPLLLLDFLLFTPQFHFRSFQHEYPVQTARLLKKSSLSGSLCAPFEWGEYLLFALYPKWRVCMDGRYDTVYSIAQIREHFALFGSFPRRSYPSLRKADCVLTPPWKPVASYLSAHFVKIFKNSREALYCLSSPTERGGEPEKS